MRLREEDVQTFAFLIEGGVRDYVEKNEILFENIVATISTATKSE